MRLKNRDQVKVKIIPCATIENSFSKLIDKDEVYAEIALSWMQRLKRVFAMPQGTLSRCCASIHLVDIETNPQLGPLQNNGGPTDTHALMGGATNAAVDAANPLGCDADLDGNGSLETVLTTDQRGELRDNFCDMGAYEHVP
jgi:hypothetical protein